MKAYDVHVRKIYDCYRLTWENYCYLKFTKFFDSFEKLVDFCQREGIKVPAVET